MSVMEAKGREVEDKKVKRVRKVEFRGRYRCSLACKQVQAKRN